MSTAASTKTLNKATDRPKPDPVERRQVGFREKLHRKVRSKTGADDQGRTELQIFREANPFRNRSPEFLAFRRQRRNR